MGQCRQGNRLFQAPLSGQSPSSRRFIASLIMPLRPEIKAILDAMPPERTLDVTGLSLEVAVAKLRSRPAAPVRIESPVATEDRFIDGPGGKVPLRLYRPGVGAVPGALVHLHGGGWVLGSIAQDDLYCHRMAMSTGCLVVSVDYRLAPEYPFPAPLEDCFCAVSWVADHLQELDVECSTVAISGFSAGGNLAAAVALRAAELKRPKICAQLLFYPICDSALDTVSYREFSSGYYLNRADMRFFWDCYCNDERQRAHPHASPLRAAKVNGLPRAMVVTAECDVLRDEAKAYADRLAAAGVPTIYRQVAGVVHGFVRMTPDASWVKDAIDEASSFIRESFPT